MKHIRHQQGRIERHERKLGPDVWVFRYREAGKACKSILGTVKELPTKRAAEAEAAKIRKRISEQKGLVTFGDLIDHYRKDALPRRVATAASYASNLRRIEERWADTRLEDIDVLEIEQWLKGLRTLPPTRKDDPARNRKLDPPAEPRLLAKKSLQNIKALMHRVWNCGIRWGVVPADSNRIALVELQGIRRPRPATKRILTPAEFVMLTSNDCGLPAHVRMMCQIAGRSAFRASEFLAFRPAEDFSLDTDPATITVHRSIVGRHQDAPKSLDSANEVAISDVLAARLREYMEANPPVNGWLFANLDTGRPWHRDALLKDHLKPAAARCGIDGIGWHSFRHTLRSLSRDAEISLEDARDILRHSSVQVTEDYGKHDRQTLRRMKASADRISEILDKGEDSG